MIRELRIEGHPEATEIARGLEPFRGREDRLWEMLPEAWEAVTGRKLDRNDDYSTALCAAIVDWLTAT